MAWVIFPALTGRDHRTHAAIFSFLASVGSPTPSLRLVHTFAIDGVLPAMPIV